MGNERINVSVTAMEEKIAALRTLKTDCEAINAKENVLVGSGLSIDMIQAVDREYAQIQKSMVTLLDNSISFFENVKKSMQEADEKAATNMHLGSAPVRQEGPSSNIKREVSLK